MTSISKESVPHANTAARPPAWLHWLAIAGAVFTWPLLLVGGTVTVYRVGMAVPDWPTTFQSNMFLYNMFEAPFGPFAEHAHRLYGAAVGLACIGIAGAFTFSRIGRAGILPFALVVASALLAIINPPGTLFGLSKAMAGFLAVSTVALLYAAYAGLLRKDLLLALVWFLIAAVTGQGVLGGIRVSRNSTLLACVHGCTAQLFFGLMIAVVVLTSARWHELTTPQPDTMRLVRRGRATLVMLLLQIISGAYVRHFGSSLAVMIHATLALAVVGHVVPLAIRVLKTGDSVRFLRGSSIWMLVFTSAQIVLGITAWLILRPFDGIDRTVSPLQALIRVSHQGAGALLLASLVAFVMLSARRLTRASNTASVPSIESLNREVLA